MTLSRRSFFTGLATLIAAPAIVRAESLMKLGPTLILSKPLTFGLDLGAEDDRTVVWQIANNSSIEFVPYKYPSLSVDEYSERILAPMVNRMQKQIADTVMYGQSWERDGLHIPLSDLLLVSQEATNSHE